jgi:hypothetical protein
MGKRFTANGVSINGIDYEVNIYDDDFSGSVTKLNISPDVLFETHGNDRDYTEIIYTATASINVFVKSSVERTFLSDILESSEGRFYLELRHKDAFDLWIRVFFGRILSNGLQIQDVSQPFIRLEAIDGLTLLKTIDYTHPVEDTACNLIDIFMECLLKIDVIDKYFDDEDAVIYFSNKLKISTLFIAEKVYHFDYFFRLENDLPVRFSCFQVIEEILKKYNLLLSYNNGFYYIIGKENFLSTNTAISKIYRKNYDVDVIEISYPPIDLLDDDGTRALNTGMYHFEPGVKRVFVETDKEFTNRNLAYGKVWKSDNPSYQVCGFMNKNAQYQTFVKLSVDSYIVPWQNPEVKFIKVAFYFKSVEFGGTDTIYPCFDFEPNTYGSHYILYTPQLPVNELTTDTDETAMIFYLFYLGKMEYSFNFVFNAETIDQKMSFRVEYLGIYDYDPNNPGIPYQLTPVSGWESLPISFDVTQSFGRYPVLISDVVKFAATSDTTEATTKTIKILAPDKYGNEMAKPIILYGSGYERSNDDWNMYGTNGSLENLLCVSALRYMAQKQKYLTIDVNVVSGIPSTYDDIEYRDDNFIVTNIAWNLYQGNMKLTMLKIPDSTPTITINSVAPKTTGFTQTIQLFESPAYSSNNPSIQGVQLHKEWENVAVNYLEVDNLLTLIYGLSDDEIKRKCFLYINGVKQRYLDDTLISQTFKFDLSLNRILFFKGSGNVRHIEFYKMF